MPSAASLALRSIICNLICLSLSIAPRSFFLGLVALKYRLSHALIFLEPRNPIILARLRLGLALPSPNNEDPRRFLILLALVRLSLGILELGTLSSLKP